MATTAPPINFDVNRSSSAASAIAFGGIPVTSAAPVDGDTLVYNAAQNQFVYAFATGGVTGPPGPTGAAGGPTGATGPTGLIQGPQGTAGPVGLSGPQGVKGPQGNPGPIGTIGSQGVAGSAGIAGNPGPIGSVGTGPLGPTGATGLQGPVGTMGAQGLQGLMGTSGAIGPAGITGTRGPIGTGPTGATGPPGIPSAITGSTGATGNSGPWKSAVDSISGTDVNMQYDNTYPAMANVNNFVVGPQTTEFVGTQMWFLNALGTANIGIFRAGTVTGTQWTQANRFQYSVAFGTNNIANQNGTLVCGSNNTLNTNAQFASIYGGGHHLCQAQGQLVMCGGGGATPALGNVQNSVGGATFFGAGVSNVNSNIGPNNGDSVLVAGSGNSTFGQYSGIGAGSSNSAQAAGGFVGAGANNTIGPAAANVNSAILCGSNNSATAVGSLVGAGVSNTAMTTEGIAFVGANNTCGGATAFDQPTVLCGASNNSNFPQATIVCGSSNAITGGSQNAIMCGVSNTVSANNSIAIGSNCSVIHTSALMWSPTTAVASTANNGATFVADGGMTVYSAATLTSGVSLAPSIPTWASFCAREYKEDVVGIECDAVALALERIPIYAFNYIGCDAEETYIGPMAGDWHAAFPSGKDRERIDTMDLDGVAMAAIIALAADIDALYAEWDDVCRARWWPE
jgi:hypothetical protein